MISGLDKLQRDLKDAQIALQELDGDLCTVRFDPFDPGSIEKAIQQVNETIDNKVSGYASNPLVRPLIEEIKDLYRNQIIEQAAEKRLQGES
ncbi:hypothetical protein [Pseudomonas syringae]|uniref:Uncharacterized protein n=1 Tax=Pseudomonas syringae pv. daphniphylli TaxID=264455 RepID=A0A9X0H2L3_PSESX|nr:hypothetical protein [Pseudomonas syringae]KPX10494.1 Uncharacterized protein ALO73_03128 [Pseudomonas syringae pv. daphniphylli]KWS87412.1 hypothetical protein AL050_24220 [Pseudomonas syringae pv. daphniphylli]